MTWSVFLFFILGGYFFSRFDPRTAQGANRLRRDQLLFHSIGVGLVLGVISFVFIHLVIAPNFPDLSGRWKEHFPQRYSGTAAGTLLLGVILGMTSRGLCNKNISEIEGVPKCLKSFFSGFRYFWLDRYLYKWVENQGSDLEKLLVHVGNEGVPVQVTLENRKVYIGMVEHFPAELESADTHLQLTLYASGYRDESKLHVVIKNRYTNITVPLEERLKKLENIRAKLEERRSDRSKNWSLCITINRLLKIAPYYTETVEKLTEKIEKIKLVVPFNRIVSVMPFDEEVFREMDGEEFSGFNWEIQEIRNPRHPQI